MKNADAASDDPSSKVEAHIVIVESDSSLRARLEQDLVKEGYGTACVAASSGVVEALQGGLAADLVLLDISDALGAPEEILDAIQAARGGLPVILLSDVSDEATVMRCLSRGAYDYVHKPFSMHDLLLAVSRVLRRKKRESTRHVVVSSDMAAEHPATGWVELTAPSDFGFLTRMQRFSQVLFNTRLSREMAEDLRMAMEEMGRNAIEWGNRFDREKSFHISYAFFNDRVVLKFEDEGEGFAPGTVPDPSRDPDAHIKRREEAGKRPGGFGLHLMQALMDEIVYSERGNVVVMTKYLSTTDGA